MNLGMFATIVFSVLIGVFMGAILEDNSILRKAFENNGIIKIDGITYRIEVVRSE